MSVTDIRIDTKFYQHPKTLKLLRRAGAEGVIGLQKVWMWAAENRPDGQLLGLDLEGLDLIAGWTGQKNQNWSELDNEKEHSSLAQVLLELTWLDLDQNGIISIHDWANNNPWAAGAPSRGDKARFSKLASVAPAVYRRLAGEGWTSITREEYLNLVGPPSNRQRPDGDEPSAPRKRIDGVWPSPSPPPSPDRRSAEKEHLSTCTSGQLEDVLRMYRTIPGYREELEAKERIWIRSLSQRYPALNLLEELEKLKEWTEKHGVDVKNSKPYITSWLERVQKERN